MIDDPEKYMAMSDDGRVTEKIMDDMDKEAEEAANGRCVIKGCLEEGRVLFKTKRFCLQHYHKRYRSRKDRKRKRDTKVTIQICLKDSCDRIVSSRGLCKSHYTRLRDKIEMGEITWEEAEKKGFCLRKKTDLSGARTKQHITGTKPAKKECLSPGCSKEEKSRGLCYTHYSSLRKKIVKGGLSWEDAERLGECLPKKGHIKPIRMEDWVKAEAKRLKKPYKKRAPKAKRSRQAEKYKADIAKAETARLKALKKARVGMDATVKLPEPEIRGPFIKNDEADEDIVDVLRRAIRVRTEKVEALQTKINTLEGFLKQL